MLQEKFFHQKIQAQYAKFLLEGISLAVTLAWSRVIDKGFKELFPESSGLTTTFMSALVLTLIAAWLLNYVDKVKTSKIDKLTEEEEE